MHRVLEQVLREEIVVALGANLCQDPRVIAQIAGQRIEHTATAARAVDAQLGKIDVAHQIAATGRIDDDGGVVFVGPRHIDDAQKVHRWDTHAVGQAQLGGRQHFDPL